MTAGSPAVTDFTPFRGAIGGILIGAAAATLLLINGNVFGCSGITSSLFLKPLKTTRILAEQWKIIFMATFFVTSSILALPLPALSFMEDPRLFEDDSLPVPSVAAYILGGLLVSFGTTLGSGCTTGHGVCGMARLSKRSIVAVLTFMALAMATGMLTSPTTAFPHAFAWLRTSSHQPVFEPRQLVWLGWMLSAIAAVWMVYALLRKQSGEEQTLVDNSSSPPPGTATASKAEVPNGNEQHQPEQQEDGAATPVQPVRRYRKLAASALAGILFSLGLAVSGMNLQSKNFAFLTLTLIPTGGWDPTLLMVMASAVMTSFVSYQFVAEYTFFPSSTITLSSPMAGGPFDIPKRTRIDWPLVGGAACFGIGWGVVGLCPGPGLFATAAGIQAVVYCYLPAYVVGGYAADFVKRQFVNS